jgi:hypothetical protein
MSFVVNREQCKTCIFASKSPISPERFGALKKAWETEGVVQECHHSTVNNLHIACRGYYEALKRGEIENNPLAAAAASIGIPVDKLRPEQLHGLAESQGWVKFVGVREMLQIASEQLEVVSVVKEVWAWQAATIEDIIPEGCMVRLRDSGRSIYQIVGYTNTNKRVRLCRFAQEEDGTLRQVYRGISPDAVLQVVKVRQLEGDAAD